MTIKKKPHTLILDRGRITQVSATQLTLRESRRGSPPSSRSRTSTHRHDLRGSAATIYFLRRGMNAQTMRIDGGPAVRIRATP